MTGRAAASVVDANGMASGTGRAVDEGTRSRSHAGGRRSDARQRQIALPKTRIDIGDGDPRKRTYDQTRQWEQDAAEVSGNPPTHATTSRPRARRGSQGTEDRGPSRAPGRRIAGSAGEEGPLIEPFGQPGRGDLPPGCRAATGHDDPQTLLTAERLAERLSVPKSWIYAEARAGRMPHVRLGRYRRFRWADIERWLDERERGTAP